MNHTKEDVDAMAHEAAANFRKIVQDASKEMLERFEQFAKVTIYATELARLVEEGAARGDVVAAAKSLRTAIDETTR